MRRLKGHEDKLRRAGLGALYLFGSTAWDEAGEGSDVDLMYEAADRDHFGLFDVAEIHEQLMDLLGSKANPVSRYGLCPRVRTRIGQDVVRIFDGG